MKPRFVLFAIAFVVAVTLNGQQKWNLRASFGAASGSSIVDGYYFSFEIGIPIIKSIQLTPAFSYADMLPNTYFSNGWDASNPFPYSSVPVGGPIKESVSGESLGSISLLLVFLPFDLFKGEKLKKHELMIGAGCSFNSYTMVGTRYFIQGDDYEVLSFSLKSNKAIEPFYCKIGYNYLFRDNLFIGFVAGLNGYDGEAELLTGIQFGVKF